MSTNVKQGQHPKQQKQQQQQQQQQDPQQQEGLSKKQQYQQATKQKKYKYKKSSPWLITAVMGLIPGFTLLTSFVATIIRLFSGWSVKRSYMGDRPAKYLKLYEYEGDPNSRLVREALTMLDLDCIILPCPKGSKRFRAEAIRIGGKEKFPLLVDDNNDRKLYGARNIVPYLFRTYGNGNIPLVFRLPFVTLGSFFASLVRGFAGVRRKKGIRDMTNIDPTSIELYAYEASPHCRLVREVLSEMEIPYLLHNVGKRSPKRKQFVERSGRMMVPFLVDSNTNKGSQGLFESCDIMKYLCKTYGNY